MLLSIASEVRRRVFRVGRLLPTLLFVLAASGLGVCAPETKLGGQDDFERSSWQVRSCDEGAGFEGFVWVLRAAIAISGA